MAADQVNPELLARIAAYEEIGHPHEEAVVLAMRDLDRLAPLLDDRDSEGGPQRPHRLGIFRRLAAVPLAWMTGASLIALLLVALARDTVNYSFGLWLHILIWLLLPIAAGAGVGLTARSRPAATTLACLGLLGPPTLAFYLAWARFQGFTPGALAGLAFAAIHLLAWAVLAPAASAVSFQITERLRSRIR